MRSAQSIEESLGMEPPQVQQFRADSTPITAEKDSPSQFAISSEEIQLAARNELDFLAGLAMPEVFQYCFPPVFQSVWRWLLSYIHLTRDFSQLALGLPRGFGKTMLMKIFILYVILFTSRKFILILCENQTKANNIIADIVSMLNEPNIKAAFGDWSVGASIDRQDLKVFGFRGRNIILMGAGAGSGIRGITLNNERPDVMVFDDIQSKADAESQTVSEQLETWMFGTAMKAKSPHGCLFIFIANMYPTKHSILRKLKSNPNWVKFIAGGILENGESLWEELQPIKQLLNEFQNDLLAGHPEIFYSEVLNDENASANNLIDISKIPAYPFQKDDIPAGNFIIIDPSNDKANSDAVSIGYFEVHDLKPCLLKLKEGRFSPGETIREALKIALEKRCSLIAVESNAFQYSLLYWFQFICQQQGIQGIQAVEVYSGSYSKVTRIINMFKSLTKGEILYNTEVAPAVNLQITQFNPLKKDNVDGVLDLLAYAPKVLEMYGDYIGSSSIIESQEWQGAKVIEHNSAF